MPSIIVKHIKHNTSPHPQIKRRVEHSLSKPLESLEDAHMGDEKGSRIDGALSSLVDKLTPSLPEEDKAFAKERRENALELARSILHR